MSENFTKVKNNNQKNKQANKKPKTRYWPILIKIMSMQFWCWVGWSKPPKAYISHGFQLQTLNNTENNYLGHPVVNNSSQMANGNEVKALSILVPGVSLWSLCSFLSQL